MLTGSDLWLCLLVFAGLVLGQRKPCCERRGGSKNMLSLRHWATLACFLNSHYSTIICTSTVNEDTFFYFKQTHAFLTRCVVSLMCRWRLCFWAASKFPPGIKEEDAFNGRDDSDAFTVVRLMARQELRVQLANPISDPEMKGVRWTWHQHQTSLDVGGCAVPPHFLIYILLQYPLRVFKQLVSTTTPYWSKLH